MVLCELFAASFVKLQKPLNEGGGGLLCFFTGQVYGCTPAADIQTIGRKVIEHIKR